METGELADRLVNWIRDRVSEARCRGVVLGLSGGIDSAVTGVLCKRAFPDTTLGVLMPCHSNPEDGEHALALASRFSIRTREVVLDSVYDALAGALPGFEAESQAGLPSKANVKARLRMVTLYFFANQFGYLVVGASNRSEIAVGYFTKYGDGGVDIAPLGNLVKRQVRELAIFLGVPAEIVEKPPSAGLWPGQTDEEELGLTYEEIDNYLLKGRAREDVRRRIEAMREAAQHKRRPPPIPDF